MNAGATPTRNDVHVLKAYQIYATLSLLIFVKTSSLPSLNFEYTRYLETHKGLTSKAVIIKLQLLIVTISRGPGPATKRY